MRPLRSMAGAPAPRRSITRNIKNGCHMLLTWNAPCMAFTLLRLGGLLHVFCSWPSPIFLFTNAVDFSCSASFLLEASAGVSPDSLVAMNCLFTLAAQLHSCNHVTFDSSPLEPDSYQVSLKSCSTEDLLAAASNERSQQTGEAATFPHMLIMVPGSI